MEYETMSKRKLRGLRKAAEDYHQNDPAYKRDSNIQFVLYLALVLALALSVRLFLFEPVRVDGDSMYPTLYNNERMFVEKVSLWFSPPKRGEIIICYYPNYTVTCVKRVVGLPGETVRITGGKVYINDELLDESAYWNDEIIWMDEEFTVPQNSVFVMGDNRNDSKDSRAWTVGSIPYERVVGRARSVIWPISSYRPV